jgi:hypothetical protein
MKPEHILEAIRETGYAAANAEMTVVGALRGIVARAQGFEALDAEKPTNVSVNLSGTTETLRMQGYDENGNNPALLLPHDLERIEAGDYIRCCAGDAECPVCHSIYRTHPRVQGALWLRRACPDRLVKL